jgi:PP-loop superfamily ATP-utilizing enzyme
MVDHNVMRLHISVHDALAVTEIQRLEELENVVPNVEVVELRVQAPEVGVIDILEDERRRLAL